MKAMKFLAGPVMALALLGFAPVNAAPAGSAAIGIERSDVAPAAQAVHYRKHKHKYNHAYRGHHGHRHYGHSAHRGYRHGHAHRPGVYLNLGGDRRGYRHGYHRTW